MAQRAPLMLWIYPVQPAELVASRKLCNCEGPSCDACMLAGRFVTREMAALVAKEALSLAQRSYDQHKAASHLR